VPVLRSRAVPCTLAVQPVNSLVLLTRKGLTLGC